MRLPLALFASCLVAGCATGLSVSESAPLRADLSRYRALEITVEPNTGESLQRAPFQHVSDMLQRELVRDQRTREILGTFVAIDETDSNVIFDARISDMAAAIAARLRR